MFYKNGVYKTFLKFTGKDLCLSLFFNKVAGLKPGTLLKKRLWHRCFLVTFVKFLRTPIFTEHLQWLLLMLVILAFTPPNLAIHYFEVLKKNNSPKLEPFFDSFEDNYRGCSLKQQQRRAPMLSVEIWFMFKRVEIGLPRTTNTVEGWHRVFQHTVGYAHPTNYKLIESIQ